MPPTRSGPETEPGFLLTREPVEAQIDVSIIIPCRNEAATVAACVADARDALNRCGYAGEIVVVDNASTDATAQVALRAGARVVSQPIRGYGAACLRGIEEARGGILVFVDGDGTYDLSILHRFVEPLHAGYDSVIGTRRNGLIREGAMRRRHRHVLEPIQTWLARRFFRSSVSDVRCGVRSLTREAAEELNLGATGMEFASEMLLESARAGLAMVEVPVEFRARPAHQSRRSLGDGWRVARYLLLMSPMRLFVVPGLLLLVSGLVLELSLVPGPVQLGPVRMDYHFMFVGSAMALLGLQVALLGVYANTYALVQNAGPYDPWTVRFHLAYTLERGVLLGAGLFAAGLIVNVYILASWLSGGAGMLFAVRPAVLALTLMVLGAEIVFASFFLTLLRGSDFGRA